jgi:hypothetical protein
MAGFLWLFIITASYYVTHKPFTASVALALILAIWRVLAAFGLTALGGALGKAILRLDGLDPLVRATLESAFGLGMLAFGTLLIGSTLGFSRWVFWIALIALLLLLRWQMLSWLRQWQTLGGLWHASDGFGRTVAVLIGSCAVFTLTIALSPPVKFDALAYHLTLPQTYLEGGRVVYLPWHVMTGLPQTVEMLYTWMMALAGAEGAAVLGWLASHMMVLGLVAYLRQSVDLRAAWVGAAALMGGYTLAASTAWAYVDWWGLVFGFGMLVCLDHWQQEQRTNWLVYAGLFAGLALSCKYTAGVALLAGLVFVLWHTRRSMTDLVKSGGMFATAAVVVMLPWLVKNTLTTGNPVYPLYFDSGAMTAVRRAVFQELPHWGDWRDALLLPWRATYLGVDGYDGYSVSIGPLLLGLGALFWLNWRGLADRVRRTAETAAVIGMTGLAIWAVGNQFSGYLIQTRFYYSVFPAFAVLAAIGYHNLNQYHQPPVRLARLASALVLLVLGLNLVEVGSDALVRKAPQAALGQEAQVDYLTGNLGWYYPAVQAVNGLPEGSKVLLLYENRSYHCRPICFPDEILDRWRRDRIEYDSAAGVLDAWRDEGFTHVLISRAGAAFLRESGDVHSTGDDWRALDDLYHLLGAGVDFGGVYSLHDLRP